MKSPFLRGFSRLGPEPNSPGLSGQQDSDRNTKDQSAPIIRETLATTGRLGFESGSGSQTMKSPFLRGFSRLGPSIRLVNDVP